MDLLLDPVIIASTVVFFVVGLLVGSWWTLLLPVVAWGLYFVGLAAGWWGGPPGEYWQMAFMLEVLLGTVAIAAGVAIRHRFVNR